MAKKLPFLLALLGASSLLAENSITRDLNFYRAGDQITKQQVEFVDPGDPGQNVVWNFSRLKTVNEKYNLWYLRKTRKDPAHMVCLEHRTSYRYELKGDTLWMMGYDNSTTKMCFIEFEMQLRYPFQYGDSLYSAFSGTGKYCQKVDLVAKGETFVKADASGTLITPTNDTLYNVLRVKRLRHYTEIGVGSTHLQLESYSWYARGYRYPVFETVKSNVLQGDSTMENFSTAFYYPIKDLQALAEDPENEALRNEDPETEDIILNCKTYPNPIDNNLTIRYELSREARVAYKVCNLSGLPVASLSARTLPAGNQQQSISMSGCTPGDYVLHITVNNKVYLVTLIKR